MSFQPLEPDDVINLDKAHVMSQIPTTVQYREIVEKLKQMLFHQCACKDDWFTKGAPCKMLRSGEQWKTGRVRLRIEFEEDVS